MLFLAYRIRDFLLRRVSMEIKAKFWIENRGEVVLGGGKTALLLAVDRLGSIQQAADKFGMSYRHAWGVIKKIEQRAGFKLVDTKLGGKDGGGAQLTPKAKEFIKKTDSLLRDLQAVVEKRFRQKFQDYSLK
jgi:molybdate transport system regulatory protein